jgi:hypothetical protein
MAILKGQAAQAMIQGEKKAIHLVSVTKNSKWDDTAGKFTDAIDHYGVVVASPATRYERFTIKVPPEGFALPLTDDDLEAIAEGNGIFPLVAFEGLTAEPWSRKDSKAVNYKTEAKRVFLCDENGKPKQP